MKERYFRDQALGANKRERTRSALLDAAIRVIAEKGMEALKISDITTAADLANGTFYNHFSDKNEILREAAYGIALEVSRLLDAQMEEITDGPTRVVTATAAFIDLVVVQPDWAAIMIDSTSYLPQLRDDVFTYLRKDIDLGIAQCKFDVDVTPFLIEQIVSLIIAAVRHQLTNGAEPEITRQACDSVLRLLGLSPAKAMKIARTG